MASNCKRWQNSCSYKYDLQWNSHARPENMNYCFILLFRFFDSYGMLVPCRNTDSRQCTNQRLQISSRVSGLSIPCCLWSFGTKMGMKYETEQKTKSMICLSPINRRYAKEEIFFIVYNCYHNQSFDFLTQIRLKPCMISLPMNP